MRRTKSCLYFALLLSSVAYGETPARSKPTTLAFSHANVISMEDDRVLRDQTVIVRSGKILRLGPSSKVAVPQNAVVIDSSGKYLLPGLADLHVHIFSGDDLLSYVANGVTTVLDMSGSPAHLQWRDQVLHGTLLGPTIYAAGHIIDGVPPLNETFLTAEKPDQARAMVREQKEAGYDFIKLYGTLRPDVFNAILQTAKEENIPVVGHINRQLGALEVLKSKQVLAAHLEDLLFARFDHLPNDPELEQFATAIAASHMTVTPNLNVNPNNIAQLQDLAAVLKSPAANLLPAAAYSQWMPANNRNERNDQTPAQINDMKQAESILYKLVALLRDKGVRLVLGTDAAPYGLPGLSAHQELQELVEAGFSPYQALLTATRNCGNFIAENVPNAPRFGTISEGAAADLLLLSADPLTDISNLKNFEGVMLRGQWLPRAQLTELSAAANVRERKRKKALEEIDSALESGDIGSAEQLAQPLQSRSPWIAEWVLMLKARRLESKNLPAAIRVARWNTRINPSSFYAFYLLADLLFQAHEPGEAMKQLKNSLRLEPQNATTLDLADKIETTQKPLRFTPTGNFEVEYTNDVSGESQKTTLVIEQMPNGELRGKKNDPGADSTALNQVVAGDNRMWVDASTPFGPIEFRIVIDGTNLSGFWAAPFGKNGRLRGTKTH